jgi:hypothetical protein
MGQGMQEGKYWCHTGQIYQMSAMDAHCYSIVDAWIQARVAANAIELEFDMDHFAGVKEAA